MNNQNINPGQMKRLHVLLNKWDLMEEKAELVRQYSATGETSSRKLKVWEARDLIAHLENQGPSDRDVLESMQRKMLSYGYLLGFDKPRDSNQEGKRASDINFANVDAWCRGDRCAVQKGLNQMSKQELTRALTQFEQVYKSTLNALSK